MPVAAASVERTEKTDSVAFRTDIQALRGFAVGLVLLYHANLLPRLKAGYLGVDIFFVVSGYLITGLVARAVANGTFSFADFYARRAKRLLPAAYTTLVCTILASPVFLTQPEMKDFAAQVLGAVTFTGNIALWRQTGYFEGAAHLKPLLHVWSLAIEEQYYIFLPLSLVLLPKHLWRMSILAFTASSLALCLVLLPTKPGAVFYLLPTRAWEIGLGSVGVIAIDASWVERLLKAIYWPAVLTLVVIPFYPTGAPHPGLDAIIVCISTLAILVSRRDVVGHCAPARWCANLGDISYSLYLVHWPLFALAANAWVSPMPARVRAKLTLGALLLGWLMHRLIEQPMRSVRLPFSPKTVVATACTSVGVILLAYGVQDRLSSTSRMDYAFARRANVGLSPGCDYGRKFDHSSECQTSAAPGILVWGDSYAMHLVEGIRNTTAAGVVQATKSTCGPLIGISSFQTDGFYNRKWADSCMTFNDDVLAYLNESTSVRVVVLASVFRQYLPDSHLVVRDARIQRSTGPNSAEVIANEDIAAAALTRTVEAIRDAGRRVVLVAPPPAASLVDFGRCVELKFEGRARFGADDPSCTIDEGRYRAADTPVHRLLDRIRRETNVSVVRLDDLLCHDGRCDVEMEGVPLYRDQGHLSYDGSRLIGQKLNIGHTLESLAQ